MTRRIAPARWAMLLAGIGVLLWAWPSAVGWVRILGYAALAWAVMLPSRKGVHPWAGLAVVAVAVFLAAARHAQAALPALVREAWLGLLGWLLGWGLAFLFSRRGYDPHFDFLPVPWVYGLLARYGHRARPGRLLRLATIQPKHDVLDLGGGAGRVARFIQARRVIIVDPSLAMLTSGPNQAHVRRVQGFAEALPLPNHSVDRIIIVDTFHHIRGKEEALREVWRVLRPGGRLVIEEPDATRWVGRLIAWGERVLAMNSSFWPPEVIPRYLPDAKATIVRDAWRAWIVLDKPDGQRTAGS
ncbi:MAG: methyltransferase domain-containing protein [Chloroflexi bacterium]|nr:methyltransferase domain-containing protein [Chloroflexota bacterium]